MIPLILPSEAEPGEPYVVRLGDGDARLVTSDRDSAVYAGERGLFAVSGANADALHGDVVLVSPSSRRIERLIRAGSEHNSLLVTERCDQLCTMCSQPPKKTHLDRFGLLEDACLLAPANKLLTISGGEPTLYKERLLDMIETVLRARSDLGFHVLSNGQHFEEGDIERLSDPIWARVSWGIPLYAADDALHDRIVEKDGAAARLRESFARLIRAGTRIELRTVVLASNAAALPALGAYVGERLQAVEQWSIMQLESAGFARTRWRTLRYDHGPDFGWIGRAIDQAELRGIAVRLFNFARCTVPETYRDLAVASISDWKRRYPQPCSQCRERDACSGFFEWHPEDSEGRLTPL